MWGGGSNRNFAKAALTPAYTLSVLLLYVLMLLTLIFNLLQCFELPACTALQVHRMSRNHWAHQCIKCLCMQGTCPLRYYICQQLSHLTYALFHFFISAFPHSKGHLSSSMGLLSRFSPLLFVQLQHRKLCCGLCVCFWVHFSLQLCSTRGRWRTHIRKYFHNLRGTLHVSLLTQIVGKVDKVHQCTKVYNFFHSTHGEIGKNQY